MATIGPELRAQQREVEDRARELGLDVPEVTYELVDHRELNEIAAYGGFPVRYPHWRFGMEYDRLLKGHTYGLQRIYELVVNTEPVVAYLLRQNSAVEQKLVMAHVCGHADFFRANAWFSHTDRNMLDVMASHGARIRALADRHGRAEVESFVDRVLSLDNLVDAGAMSRARRVPGNAPPLDGEAPAGDVLGHLLLFAPLAGWQQEVLALLRDEAYYFLPQALTKVMNEGWASFWHSRLMTGTLLRDAEVVDYAESHAGAMGGDGPMNPYKLGLELYLSLLDRAGGDLRPLFEARAIHNDVTFVENFLDPAFCLAHGLAESEEQFWQVREETLASLTNGGHPVIRLVAGEGPDLELVHCWSGNELQLDQAEETLRCLHAVWRGPVRLYTRSEDRALLLTCTGDGPVEREFGESLTDGSAGRADDAAA
jgi:stage V sporulation protein R